MANYPHDDPDEGYEENDCDHDDYEGDILTGRAHCWRCGHSWYQSTEEIEAEAKRLADYAEWERKMQHPWYRAMERVRSEWSRRKWQVRQLFVRRKPLVIDDEIPF